MFFFTMFKCFVFVSSRFLFGLFVAVLFVPGIYADTSVAFPCSFANICVWFFSVFTV